MDFDSLRQRPGLTGVRPAPAPAPPMAASTPPPAGGERRLVLSATSKGGIGKSFLTINLAQWYRDNHFPFTAFDPDFCNSTLTRYLPEAVFLDIRDSTQLDGIIRAFDETNIVLVDGIGSMQGLFLDWFEETGLFELREQLNLQITLLLIIEEDKETVFQSGEVARRVGDNASYLVARNQKHGTTTRIYDGSKARQELQRLGAREITIERLPERLSAILQSGSKTLTQAIDDPSVFFLDRQRLKAYQRGLYLQFHQVQDLLLPLRVQTAAAPPPERPRFANLAGTPGPQAAPAGAAPSTVKPPTPVGPRIPPAEV